MKKLESGFRPWAVLLALAIAAAAIGFATTSPKELEKKASGPLKRQNAASPKRAAQSDGTEVNRGAGLQPQGVAADRGTSGPIESRLVKANSFDGDLRNLPTVEPEKFERPEREQPEPSPMTLGGGNPTEEGAPVSAPQPGAPAPPPLQTFEGMNFAANGNGHPPDTNGDVGPNHYIQTINTSIGIYNKNGTVAAGPFTFNSFMSQGNFGNLCDTNNFGDPVVLYDTFEDRWIITDFAFQLSGGAVVNPPGTYQCFAASKTGDPVAGGWNFFSLHLTDFLNDYPKFGIWPDGLYMSSNLFGFPANGSFAGVRVWALNKAQMYSGSPTVQVVSFNVGGGDFTLLPSNARLQVGTPPTGTPNFFASTWEFLNALTVYKFHVDWNSISLSTFTGPDTPIAATGWPNQNVANAQSLGGNNLDVLQIRAMMQNQYTNLGGAESLWVDHTVRRALNGLAAPRFYQVNVTGGTVAAALPQAATFDPDGANVISRFMPSLAIDRAGNMALGYSTSNSTTKPAIKYAGRLSTDPINTFPQTEQLLIQGTGTQLGNCGGAPCIRWGDYSAMTLDPDGCTFWYTNEYYQVDGLDHHTRVGSFKYNQCTPVGTGTVTGTVTATFGGAPISGATVTLGVRNTTTNGAGVYSFLNIPAGTYPTMTASYPGYNTATASSIVVTDGATTTQNFSLGLAPQTACLTDTTQADFQGGVGTNVDLTTSPGDVILAAPSNIDQQNTAGTNTGTSFATTSWGGQTFIPAVTGQLTRVDAQLFCSGCTGTTPNLTLSVRNTSGGLPTGADLATATIPGFSSGAAVYYAANFSSPPTLTSGTQYALILRPVANPSPGGYFWIRSSPSTYANGQRVISADNGATWTADSTRDFNFKTYINTGFTASGDLVSSLKDSNPAVGSTPNWTTLSWTATVPAGTSLKFQAAASNNALGPFSFVGPDGTAGTFFTTSGASLAQFTGFRYLKYRAFLSTTNSAMTPTLNDVTVCFSDVAKTLVIGPSSMEGDLKNILPGNWVNAGYHFKLGNKNHPADVLTVNGTVSLAVKCSDGSTPAGSPIVVPLGTNAYPVPAGNTDWLPSGDQLAAVNWQGAVQAPNLCVGIGTGAMRNQVGAVFTGMFGPDPATSPITIQFHYRVPAAKGKPDTNCSNTTDPNRSKADVCGAGWSETKDP
jgi:Carboxypeptidase regulatory-like domain